MIGAWGDQQTIIASSSVQRRQKKNPKQKAWGSYGLGGRGCRGMGCRPIQFFPRYLTKRRLASIHVHVRPI